MSVIQILKDSKGKIYKSKSNIAKNTTEKNQNSEQKIKTTFPFEFLLPKKNICKHANDEQWKYLSAYWGSKWEMVR